MPDDAPPALTYEAARDELVEVVRRLEQGGASLEESLALWERGEELARTCRAWLEGAQARLDAVLAERAGRTDDGRRRTGDGPGGADDGAGRTDADGAGRAEPTG